MSTLNVCGFCLAHGEIDGKGNVRTINHYEDCQMVKSVRRGYRHMEKDKKCLNCSSYGGEGGKLLKCSGCLCVFYCSVECQKSNWKNHKSECKYLRIIMDNK
jgi:hypothetical protein